MKLPLTDWVAVENVFLELHRKGVALPPCPAGFEEARRLAEELAVTHGVANEPLGTETA